MSKADSIKAWLDFLKLALTALLGLLFVIFWGLIQNDSIVKNMSRCNRVILIFIIIFAVGLIIAIINEYKRNMKNLEMED